MSAEELLQLAEKVEGLSGPNRDVDVLIALAQPETFFNAGPRYAGAEDRIGKRMPDGDHIPGQDEHMLVPAYTASLDAAMTLVPEDALTWHAGKHLKTGEGQAYVLVPDRRDPLYVVTATPALALTAAALRARASLFGKVG